MRGELHRHIGKSVRKCKGHHDAFCREADGFLYPALLEMKSRYQKLPGARSDLHELPASTWHQYLLSVGVVPGTFRSWKSRTNSALKQLQATTDPPAEPRAQSNPSANSSPLDDDDAVDLIAQPEMRPAQATVSPLTTDSERSPLANEFTEAVEEGDMTAIAEPESPANDELSSRYLILGRHVTQDGEEVKDNNYDAQTMEEVQDLVKSLMEGANTIDIEVSHSENGEVVIESGRLSKESRTKKQEEEDDGNPYDAEDASRRVGRPWNGTPDVTPVAQSVRDDDQSEVETRALTQYRVTLTVEDKRLSIVQKKIRQMFPGLDEDDIEVEKLPAYVSRPNRLDEAAAQVEGAKETVDQLAQELREWRDNLPENLQCGEKASALEEAISALESLSGELENIDWGNVEFLSMM